MPALDKSVAYNHQSSSLGDRVRYDIILDLNVQAFAGKIDEPLIQDIMELNPYRILGLYLARAE